MAKIQSIRKPASTETPKQDKTFRSTVEPTKTNPHTDPWLTERLDKIATHLEDLASGLFEKQDQGGLGEVGDMMVGTQLLIDHYAAEIRRIAGFYRA